MTSSPSGASIAHMRAGSQLATYPTMAEAFARNQVQAYQRGDTYIVTGDFTGEDCGYLGIVSGGQPAQDITIIGQVVNGRRPHITLDGACSSNALNQSLFYLGASSDCTIQDLVFTCTPQASVGKAGLYIDASANPTLKNVGIHNFAYSSTQGNGLFTTGGCTGRLSVLGCDLRRNGGGGRPNSGDPMHNAYCNASLTDPGFEVYVEGTLSKDAVYGHLWKSRAQRTTVKNSHLIGNGLEGYCLDVPQGGVLTLTGSTLSRAATGNGVAHVTWGVEWQYYPLPDFWTPSLITIEGNTFIVVPPGLNGANKMFPMFFEAPPNKFPDFPGSPTWRGIAATITGNTFTGFETTGIGYEDFRGT